MNDDDIIRQRIVGNSTARTGSMANPVSKSGLRAFPLEMIADPRRDQRCCR
jgi:hypothetical protein